METINFNIKNTLNIKYFKCLCEKFNLFPNQDIYYAVNVHSAVHYLDFTIHHVKGATPYTEIKEYSQNIFLTIDGELDDFIHWLVGIFLPGLCQPAMPAVDIVDILHLLKNASKSTNELVDNSTSTDFSNNTNTFTGALFIFHNPLSYASNDNLDKSWMKQQQYFDISDNQKELLFIKSVPVGLEVKAGEYLNILEDFYPSNITKYTQRLLFCQ